VVPHRHLLKAALELPLYSLGSEDASLNCKMIVVCTETDRMVTATHVQQAGQQTWISEAGLWSISVWRHSVGECIQTLVHPGKPCCLFLVDEDLLVSCSYRNIRVWNIGDGSTMLHDYNSHDNAMGSWVAHKDLVYFSAGNEIHSFHVRCGTLIRNAIEILLPPTFRPSTRRGGSVQLAICSNKQFLFVHCCDAQGTSYLMYECNLDVPNRDGRYSILRPLRKSVDAMKFPRAAPDKPKTLVASDTRGSNITVWGFNETRRRKAFSFPCTKTNGVCSAYGARVVTLPQRPETPEPDPALGWLYSCSIYNIRNGEFERCLKMQGRRPYCAAVSEVEGEIYVGMVAPFTRPVSTDDVFPVYAYSMKHPDL